MEALRKDGTEVPIELSLTPMQMGTERFAIAIARDITERKRAEKQILAMARFDPLTGLFNRTTFAEWVQKGVARVKRGGKGFALLHLDLDHFKDVNDALGHPRGDALLRAVGERLRSNIRETDVVARLGADEFAVMEVDLNGPEDASILARKLLDVLEPDLLDRRNPDSRQRKHWHCRPRAGRPEYRVAALLCRGGALPRQGGGSNTLRFFTDSMDTEVRARFTLAAELRDALDEDQLFLVNDPQVDASTNRIIGLESLVRWRHPHPGVCAPANLSAPRNIAGSSSPWAWRVLHEACEQMKQWVDAGIAPRSVSVGTPPPSSSRRRSNWSKPSPTLSARRTFRRNAWSWN